MDCFITALFKIFYELLYYKNSKQTRASTNWINQTSKQRFVANCTAKLHSFLVNNTTLHKIILCLTPNPLEIIKKVINEKIRNETIQCNINREAAKISALLPEKIDKYEYLTGKEILWSGPSQIIEKAKFTYSPFGKTFQKQRKPSKMRQMF